jgi:hypothetical protein
MATVTRDGMIQEILADKVDTAAREVMETRAVGMILVTQADKAVATRA